MSTRPSSIALEALTSQIEVYSTDNCPWCVRAKSLLRSKGLDYEEIFISADTELAREMLKRSGRRTVP